MNMTVENMQHFLYFMIETLNEILTHKLTKSGKGVFPPPNPMFSVAFRVMFEYVWLSSSVMILVVTVKELGRILLWVISFSHQAIAL